MILMNSSKTLTASQKEPSTRVRMNRLMIKIKNCLLLQRTSLRSLPRTVSSSIPYLNSSASTRTPNGTKKSQPRTRPVIKTKPSLKTRRKKRKLKRKKIRSQRRAIRKRSQPTRNLLLLLKMKQRLTTNQKSTPRSLPIKAE